jgi:hypothetical protein
MENLQIDLNRLGEWAVENAMVINPGKSKAVCFTRARVMEMLSYSLRDTVIQFRKRAVVNTWEYFYAVI